MWINSNVVRKSPSLSIGQAVQRCFAGGQNRGAPCCCSHAKMLSVSLCLVVQRAVDDRKRRLPTYRWNKYEIFMASKLPICFDIWGFWWIEYIKLPTSIDFFRKIGGKCLFCFAISSLLFLCFSTSLLLFSAHLLIFCAWKFSLCLYLCRLCLQDFFFVSTDEDFCIKRRLVFHKTTGYFFKTTGCFLQSDGLLFIKRQVVFWRSG